MRNLIFAINVSIDGCCDHTKFNPDDEVHDYFTDLTREAGILLYGRITYQLMVPYWPEVARHPSDHERGEIEFAQAFDAVPQIVVCSRSLKKAEGKNTTIVRDNFQEEIIKLKQGKGKNILTGGVAVPSQLMELGLVDEIHLVVHPGVVGKGRRLFDESNLLARPDFKLVASKIFKSGSVALHYLKSGTSRA